MRVDRRFLVLSGWIFLLFIRPVFQGCQVYTINKTDLETELKPSKGLSIVNMYRKTYRNAIDTLWCSNEIGQKRMKRFNHDSKITIVTKENKAIRFYAKTLYIYKNEFLIGERTAPRLRGPNYFPVRLSEIDRIEVTGVSF